VNESSRREANSEVGLKGSPAGQGELDSASGSFNLNTHRELLHF